MFTYRVNNFPVGYQEVPGSLLEYQLTPMEKSLGFQVTFQNPQVTNFLKKNRFQASNGLIVDISKYPEYKESELTIYLQGSDAMRNIKTDVTHFYSNKVRDHRKAMIESALRELVAHVKKINAWQAAWYTPQRPTVVKEYNVCYPKYIFGF